MVARSIKAAAVSYPRGRYPFMQSRLLHGFSFFVGEKFTVDAVSCERGYVQ